jgi:hypothetical protein
VTDDARLVIGFKRQVSPYACIFIPAAGVMVILQRDSIFDTRVQYADICSKVGVIRSATLRPVEEVIDTAHLNINPVAKRLNCVRKEKL